MVSRAFTVVTLALATTIAFMIGLIVARSAAQAPEPTLVTPPAAAQPAAPAMPAVAAPAPTRQAAGLVNFADVAERMNPAVVNIEATTRGADISRRRRAQPD